MNITLLLGTAEPGSSVSDGPKYRKGITLPDGTDISQLCRKFNIDSVARYVDDGSEGHILGKYISEGPLEDGMVYRVFDFGGKRVRSDNKRSIKKFMSLEYNQ